MNKENQIEEMQKCIAENTAVYDSDVAQDVAETLIYAGYRKASDVVREIIDVIAELHDHFKSVDDIREAFAMLFVIAELKKKYTEENR